MDDSFDRSGYKPVGWHSVTPRIIAHDAERLVQFIRRVFAATGDDPADRPAVMTIGDSMIMISEAGVRDPMPAFLYVYVADADEVYRQAIAAGATSLEEPSDVSYGDRRAIVIDRWGNTWQIATQKAR